MSGRDDELDRTLERRDEQPMRDAPGHQLGFSPKQLQLSYDGSVRSPSRGFIHNAAPNLAYVRLHLNGLLGLFKDEGGRPETGLLVMDAIEPMPGASPWEAGRSCPATAGRSPARLGLYPASGSAMSHENRNGRTAAPTRCPAPGRAPPRRILLAVILHPKVEAQRDRERRAPRLRSWCRFKACRRS